MLNLDPTTEVFQECGRAYENLKNHFESFVATSMESVKSLPGMETNADAGIFSVYFVGSRFQFRFLFDPNDWKHKDETHGKIVMETFSKVKNDWEIIRTFVVDGLGNLRESNQSASLCQVTDSVLLKMITGRPLSL